METNHTYTLAIRDDTAEQTVCELTFEASRSALVALLRTIIDLGDGPPALSVFKEENDA